jgi:ABC-type sugar transport systems, permease components
MTGPAVLVLLVVLGYPLYLLVSLTFQNFGPQALFTGKATSAGLSNYTAVLQNPEFWQVLGRTALYVVATAGLVLVLGMLVAHMLRRLSPVMRLTTMITLVLVWAMPMVTASLIWQWLFQPQYGVMNWLVTQLGVFGDYSAHNWFMDPVQALVLIIVLEVWKGLPFVALVLYAGLSQIPDSMFEAATLDGAGAWQSFSTITLPMLRPVVFLVSILEVIWTVNSFVPIWILTKGGPNGGTTTLGVWAYLNAFVSNDYGRGATIAVLTVVILAVFTSIYVRRLVMDEEIK